MLKLTYLFARLPRHESRGAQYPVTGVNGKSGRTPTISHLQLDASAALTSRVTA